jgi:thiol-disulfide isomerase/thioredoxin
MFGLFLLSLRMDMNLTQWNEYVQKDAPLPFFCMLWAPWCSYCQRMHPIWVRLQDEYENDTNIMLGAVNCVDHPVCELNGIGLFPTFVEYYQGQFTNTTDDNKTVEIFQYLADRLLEKKTGSPFRTFKGKIDAYPSFLFQIKKRVNYSAIHTLKRAIIASGTSCPFYLEVKSTHPEIPSIFAYETSLGKPEQFQSNFTVPDLVGFILDHSHLIDLNWSVKTRHQTDLLFAVLVSGDVTGSWTIKSYARKHRGRYAWGTTRDLREVNDYFKLQKDDLPAVLLVNETAGSFAVLKQALDGRDIKKFLSANQHIFSPITIPEEGHSWVKIGLASLCGVLLFMFLFYWFVFRRTSKQD